MKKLTLFTVLGVLISLVINFGSPANINLINNTAMAKGVEMQNSQADNENTPNCALNQLSGCSETLLSQATSQLVGVWKLTNYETKNSTGEILTQAPWHFTDGLLMYDSKGNMAVQLVDDSHPKFPDGKFADIVKNQLTPEVLKASLLGYLAYFGTYTVNEEKGFITHHVKASTSNTSGTDQQRGFELQGNSLVLTKLASSNLGKKDQLTTKITWQRMG